MSENQPLTRFRRKAVKVEDALQSIISYISKAKTEKVSLEKSLKRTLSEDIQTSHPVPHFRRSGYDGYAVQSKDVEQASKQSPVYLKLVDDIPCGEVPGRRLESGQTARIMTGAMVPEEADSVIMLEATEQEERNGSTYVKFTKPIQSGKNITPIGEETAEGEVLLTKGTEVNPGAMAVLSSLGFSQVPVYKKPQIAVLSTGTELLEVDEPLEMGKIRNSNTYMIAGQIQHNGGEPVIIEKFPDDVDAARKKLQSLLANQELDMIITTGGVSVGDYDIMTDIFLNWEGKTLFNKVQMRPGSVTTAGVFRDKILFGLSGNPGASYVGFELFVKPSIERMLGGLGVQDKQTAYLKVNYTKVNAFPRFLRGYYEVKDGELWAQPVGLDQSSALLSMKDTNALIVIPPTKTGMKAGEKVNVIPV
ncbi:molybdopterin molybdotransferase [Salinibacillus kushneri]|uniref:Molybdopterin molybdenumtransferase n=1 Tax=Salinibacillus kushneri TaxID=237682 RepID=A0A1I0IMX1_9BACI|nr:gephyrin-like molybdotransferase Glp [Salinibacillus kushneri]SET98470.1 molybdopterin molybdotransferase [Salinibacillus kushneri]